MIDKIGAIHPEELIAALERLGLRQEIENGKAECICCRKKITMTNFKAITKHLGKIMYACDSDICVMTLAGLESEKGGEDVA
jgi:hypothetical protein